MVGQVLRFALAVLTVFLLSACGGGGSGDAPPITLDGGGESGAPQISLDVKTGVFLDSAVEGMKYSTTSGQEGFTTAAGEFKYSEGDNIRFFIGGIDLGQTKAKTVLTTFDLEASEKVAQLLQTLDYDAFPNNGKIGRASCRERV